MKTISEEYLNEIDLNIKTCFIIDLVLFIMIICIIIWLNHTYDIVKNNESIINSKLDTNISNSLILEKANKSINLSEQNKARILKLQYKNEINKAENILFNNDLYRWKTYTLLDINEKYADFWIRSWEYDSIDIRVWLDNGNIEILN